MIQVSLDQEALTNEIRRLDENIRQYRTWSRLTTAEVISKKGNDLRIQMFRGMKSRRWGGKNSKGIAAREFKERGGRIKVRSGLDIANTPEFGKAKKGGKPRRLSLSARRVAAELTLRQKGIGVLGAAFLVRRWNAKKSRLRRNTTGAGGNAMLAEFAFDSSPLSDTAQYVATGYYPGIDIVSGRYAITRGAIAKVSADMEKYIKRKQEEALSKAFRRTVGVA